MEGTCYHYSRSKARVGETMLTGKSVTKCDPVDTNSMTSAEEQQNSPTEAADLLNRMENAGYERDKTSVEMGDVTPSSPPMNGNGVMGCTDMCLSLHQQHQKTLQQFQKSANPRPPESPWHRLKTIFLVTIIAILIVWIIVYTILTQTGVV